MGLKRATYGVARRVARLPPSSITRYAWPYLVPGAASYYSARWERRLRRAPVLTGAQHAASVGLREIEEVIGCALCGEQRMRVLFHAEARDRAWGYDVVACPACGLLYRHPGIRPERLGDLYASGYSRFLSGDYEAARMRRYELVMDSFAPLFADGAGRRLLDFGCGNGCSCAPPTTVDSTHTASIYRRMRSPRRVPIRAAATRGAAPRTRSPRSRAADSTS
jgi:hypothetical protein